MTKKGASSYCCGLSGTEGGARTDSMAEDTDMVEFYVRLMFCVAEQETGKLNRLVMDVYHPTEGFYSKQFPQTPTRQRASFLVHGVLVAAANAEDDPMSAHLCAMLREAAPSLGLSEEALRTVESAADKVRGIALHPERHVDVEAMQSAMEVHFSGVRVASYIGNIDDIRRYVSGESPVGSPPSPES